MSRRSLSISCSASLAVYLVGYTLFLVSFAFANWVKFEADNRADDYSYGLWWNCSTVVNSTVCVSYDISSLSSDWIAVQSFYIVAVIIGFVAGTVYPKIPVNAAFQIISGGGTLISVIIFGAAISRAPGEELDFAFILGPVSGVLLLCNGILLAWSVSKEGCIMDDVMPPEPGKKSPKVV